MSEPFGQNPQDREPGQGEATEGEQALGLAQAPEQKTGQPDNEPQAQSQQNQQQPHGQQVQQNQQAQQQSQSAPEGEGEQAEEGKILDKFETQEELAEGLENLEQKLKKRRPNFDLNWSAINSEEDLKAAYKEAEQALGKTSNVDQLNRENYQLKQQLQKYGQQLQQLQQQLQQVQQQPQQPQQAQQPQREGQSNNDPDPEQFVDELVTKGPEAIREVVKEMQQQNQQQGQQQFQPRQQAQQQGQQQQQPQQQDQQLTQQQMRQLQNAQRRVELKYGDQLEQHRDDVKRVLQNNPEYALMELAGQNGMDLAVQQVLAESQGQPQQQPQQNQQQAAKQAARMPQNSNNSRRQPNNQSHEEKVRQSLMQDNGTGGVFG